MVDLTLISEIFQFSYWFSLKMEVLVHPHSEILCGASLLFFFVFEKCHFGEKTRLFCDCSMICFQNEPNLLSTRDIFNKTGILDPIEFWWVP